MRGDTANRSQEYNNMEEDFDQFEKDGLWQRVWRVEFPKYVLHYSGLVYVYKVQ